MKLGNIVIDNTLSVREINSHIVAEYADAMRTGAIFPSVRIDANTNRLVCGFHRVKAYKRVFKPDQEIPAELVVYKNENDILFDAISDNTRHGLQLTTFEKKSAMLKMEDAGFPMETIADALNVSLKTLKKWTPEIVIVSGKKEPLKHGLSHLQGKSMKKQTYENIRKNYSGWNVEFHAKQILMHIKNGTLDKENESQVEILSELFNTLKKVFNK